MNNNLKYIFSLVIGIFVGISIFGSYRSHNYHISTEPEKEIEYVYIEKEPVVIHDIEYVYVEPEVVEKLVYVPMDEDFFLNLTEREEWCLKDLSMREAEGEGVIGQCWLMYTALCRCQAFGTTIEEEWASSAYTSMNRSGLTPNEDCLKAFELIREGWTPRPLYFRADHYHTFGTELCQVGNHYFSY